MHQGAIGSNVKELGLEHLHFPDMGLSGEPQDEERMSYLYSRTPFLMDRRVLLFRSGPNTPRLCGAVSFTWSIWVDTVRRVSSITPRWQGGIDPVDWVSEELNWLVCRNAPAGHSEEHPVLFETLIAILHCLSHHLRSQRHVSRQLTSGTDWQDVAMKAVSSA